MAGTLTGTGLETRTAPDAIKWESEGRKVYGYAARFNSISKNLGGFVERIQPKAFKRSIEAPNADIFSLVNHEDRLVLGRTSAKTLRVWEDSEGLGFEALMPSTTYANDLVISLDRRDVSECSFGFLTPPGGDSWSLTPENFPLRDLRDVDLREVSIVTFPAYNETSAGVRSLNLFKQRGQYLRLLADLHRHKAAG